MSALNTLDKDRLKELISTLQLASKAGFSSLSSPIEVLLEVAIDLSLLLSNQYSVGKKERISNKEIRFLDDKSDALGNPLQISFRKKRREYWDPQTAKFLKQLASFFVQLKVFSNFREAYMASGIGRNFSNKTPINPSEQNKKARKRASKIRQNKNRAFYRRQRNKRKT